MSDNPNLNDPRNYQRARDERRRPPSHRHDSNGAYDERDSTGWEGDERAALAERIAQEESVDVDELLAEADVTLRAVGPHASPAAIAAHYVNRGDMTIAEAHELIRDPRTVAARWREEVAAREAETRAKQIYWRGGRRYVGGVPMPE